MSDRDKPVNPFGSTERTIIRPNPGGRLPQSPPAAPPDPAPPPSPRAPFSPVPLGDKPAASPYKPVPPPVGPVAAPASPYARAPTIPAAEEWISSNQPPPRVELPPA